MISQEHEPEEQQRRYFRIDDEVGLLLRAIPDEEEEQEIGAFPEHAARFGILNELHAYREEHRPQRRMVEQKAPTVAAYLTILEQQIDMLSLAINPQPVLSARPKTPVNLSAQGLGLQTEVTFEPDSLVEIKLELLPERSRILTLARVVRSHEEPQPQITAFDFQYLRNADREAIIHHVHRLQLRRLREHAERDD